MRAYIINIFILVRNRNHISYVNAMKKNWSIIIITLQQTITRHMERCVKSKSFSENI